LVIPKIALTMPRGVARGIVIFLVTYVLVASITESTLV